MSVAENLKIIKEKIKAARDRSEFSSDEIKIIAVTKGHSEIKMIQAAEQGLVVFGENYAQEAIAKFDQILTHSIEWHFIGSLQTNKVKYLLKKCAYLHTLDRMELAEEINKRARALERKQKCLIQIKFDQDLKRGGCPVDKLRGLVQAASQLPYLQLEGLMCVPPTSPDPEITRRFFKTTREIRDTLKDLVPEESGSMSELSMGMSADYELAVEEGATMLRIGTAILGPRPKK